MERAALIPAFSRREKEKMLREVCRVEAGVSPAVEPGILPGGTCGRPLYGDDRDSGGETPPSTAGGTRAATDDWFRGSPWRG